MRIILRLIICFFCILPQCFGWSQIHYFSTNYGVKEGLPTEFIYRTFNLPNGQLLLATQRGLVLFDGHRFLNHPTIHSPITSLTLKMDWVYFFDTNYTQKFQEIPFKVIFTTAYDHYAIKALKINALDYLLKPIDPNELKTALDKFRHEQIFTTDEQIAHLNQFKINQLSNKLALSTNKGLVFIKIKDIMYFDADGSYTHMVMSNGDQHLVSKSLANFEEVLADNPLFFRSHKSSLVNLSFIKKYIRGEGGELILMNDKSIVLSRNKKQEFLNFFKKI